MGAKNPRRRSALASRAVRPRRNPAAEIAILEPRLLLALATTTTLAASTTAPTHGQQVTLTATVADAQPNPTPTGGSVTFLDGSTILGTMPLTNGSAQLTTSTLAAGTHKLTADYGGTANFVGSSSLISSAATTTTPGTFSAPQAAAFDAAGNLYIADAGTNKVFKLTPGGTLTTFAGTGTAGSGGDGGQATAAQLFSPRAVAVDANGDVFIADTDNSSIREVKPNGVISTFAGIPGSQGSTGDNGPATAAKLKFPQGVAVDASGDVFIADSGNNEIREVTPAGGGTIVDFAGTTAGTAGGLHSVALNNPEGVAVDAAGNLFIADTNDNRIVEIKAAGTVSTLAGTGGTSAPGADGDGGPAISATLDVPRAVAVDALGDVFIADGFNDGVRVVRPDGLIELVVPSVLPGTSIAITPEGLAVSPSGGTLDFADGTNGVVRGAAVQSLSVVVSPASTPQATTTTTLPATSAPVRGQTLQIFGVVSVNPPGTGTPTGTVTFKLGTFVLASNMPLVTQGGHTFASFTTNALTMGSYTITSTYSGDANDAPSTGSDTFVVGRDQTMMTSALSAPGPVRGQAEAIYALVSPKSPGAGTVTGTVTFKNGANVVTEPIQYINKQAYAVVVTAPLGVGSYAWTATYNGDSGDLSSTEPINFTVVKDATSLIAAPSPSSSVRGQPMTFFAVVSASKPGVGAPTGTVTFKDGATTLGSGTIATVNGGQWATFTTSTLAVGTHTITAVYNGDGGDNPSTSASFMVTVGKDATRTAGQASPATVAAGKQEIMYAFVAPSAPGAGTPTGLVNFQENGKTLGGGFLGTVNGTTYTYFITSSLSVGTHTITAVYQGDASDAGSTAATFTVTVTAASGGAAAQSGLVVASPASPPPAQGPAITPVGKLALTSTTPVTAGATGQQQAWLAALDALADEGPTKLA